VFNILNKAMRYVRRAGAGLSLNGVVWLSLITAFRNAQNCVYILYSVTCVVMNSQLTVSRLIEWNRAGVEVTASLRDFPRSQ
jgi:hypothetical protein